MKLVPIYNLTEGNSHVNIAVTQHFYICVELLDNDEIKQSTCTTNGNTEFANMGADFGGGFGITHEL